MDCYRDAIAVVPSLPRAHLNVGNALRKLNRLDEALTATCEAINQDPMYAPAHFNLATLHVERGDDEAAASELRTAIHLDSHLAEARVALADILERRGQISEAETHLRLALELRPDYAGAAINLAQILIRQRRLDEAEQWLWRALQWSPGLVQSVFASLLSSLGIRDDVDRELNFHIHLVIGRIIQRYAGSPFVEWPNTAEMGRRLRIGYVSGDFRNHPTAWFIRPVLQNHNPDTFEVYCYSNFGEPNPEAQLLQGLVKHWRDISAMTDPQVIDQVRADAIDVLVDLSGHTKHSRLHVFARHPAPVQVTWLGYLNTTGLTTMDYRICDWHTDPEGESDAYHAERLYRLPNSQWCYTPWHDIAPVLRPHPHVPTEIVFGSFNQHTRISDDCLETWCQVLRAIPSAHLRVLGIPDDSAIATLLDRFARQGIDNFRINAERRRPIREYFEAIGNVDVALDTWPYNGATTALNALWMGVPVVALCGQRGIARGTYSILQSLQMPNLVAKSKEAYVALNVKLATDIAWRNELRLTLRQRLASSPLMNSRRFVADLETGYRQMWHDWCVKQI